MLIYLLHGHSDDVDNRGNLYDGYVNDDDANHDDYHKDEDEHEFDGGGHD